MIYFGQYNNQSLQFVTSKIWKQKTITTSVVALHVSNTLSKISGLQLVD